MAHTGLQSAAARECYMHTALQRQLHSLYPHKRQAGCLQAPVSSASQTGSNMYHCCKRPQGWKLKLQTLKGVLLCRPPKVAFKWRHWGRMTGALTCPLHNGLRMIAQPTMETISVIGMAYCTLSDKFQIQNLEVFFDQNEPMSSMVKVSGSPMGLPTKGKTPGGVDVEMKPNNSPVSSERRKAITRRKEDDDGEQLSHAVEPRRARTHEPLEKAFSTESDGLQSEGSGKGILGSIWGLLGSKP